MYTPATVRSLTAILLLVASGSATLADSISPFAPAYNSKSDDLSLSLTISPDNQLTFTFKNTSNHPVVLNLGINHTNAISLHPTHLALGFTDSQGNSESYKFKIPAPPAGPVSDWLIPLRAGDSYQITVSPSDFIAADLKETLKLEKGAKLTARFEGKGQVHNKEQLVPGLPFFTHKAESISIDSPEPAKKP